MTINDNSDVLFVTFPSVLTTVFQSTWNISKGDLHFLLAKRELPTLDFSETLPTGWKPVLRCFALWTAKMEIILWSPWRIA